MTDFPSAPVGVTLTGEEWTTIIAVLARGRDGLSDHGRGVYRRAADKLAAQVCTASDRHVRGEPTGPRLVGAD
jgi:hypothetical protein